MTSSGEILLRLQGDPSKAVAALNRLSAALGETARKLGQAVGGAAVAMRKFGRHFPAPTPEERLFVRRYARAQERSRRNQPPVVWPATWAETPPRRLASASRKRRPHGRPR